MKKLVSLVVALVMMAPAFGATANARPQSLKKDGRGGYNVTYSYQDKAKSGWYGALRAELNFLSWKNEYTTDIPGARDAGSDSYSFKPIFATDIAFGKHLDYFWRGEVEAGYITQFADSDEGYEFRMSVPYVIANGYYDFTNGVYLGAGLGVALPRIELLDDAFKSGNNPKWGVSPMFGLMAGYAHQLDDNLVLDLRYRLSGFWGPEQKREWSVGAMINSFPVGGYHLKNDVSFVLDNSISVGVRYEF